MHLPKSVVYPVTDLMFSSVAWTPRPGEVDKILTVEWVYVLYKKTVQIWAKFNKGNGERNFKFRKMITDQRAYPFLLQLVLQF